VTHRIAHARRRGDGERSGTRPLRTAADVVLAFCCLWLGLGAVAALQEDTLPNEDVRELLWVGLPAAGLALALLVLVLPVAVLYWTWLGNN
jgi:hypothetical protein